MYISAETRLVITLGCPNEKQLQMFQAELNRRPHLEVLIISREQAHPVQAERLEWMVEAAADLKERLRGYFRRSNRMAAKDATMVMRFDQSEPHYWMQVLGWIGAALSETPLTLGNSKQDTLVGLKNQLFNWRAIFSLPHLEDFKNDFANIPAILVASGPSLEKSMPLLKEAQNRALIFAADSALHPLLNAGIIPHFVTALERDVYVLRFFQDLKPEEMKDTVLLAPQVVLPDVFQTYQGPRVMMMRDYAFVNAMSVGKTTYRIGPTVGNMNHLAALHLGCSPMILVGQDLAHDPNDKRSHTRGTIFKERDHVPSEEELKAQGLYEVQSNSGTKVFTSTILDLARRWFEEEILQFKTSLLNTSAYGAIIKGTKLVDVAETLASLPPLPESVAATFENLRTTATRDLRETTASDMFLKRIKGYQDGVLEIERALGGLSKEIKSSRQKTDFKTLGQLASRVERAYIEIVGGNPVFEALLKQIMVADLVGMESKRAELARRKSATLDYVREFLGVFEALFDETLQWTSQVKMLVNEVYGDIRSARN